MGLMPRLLPSGRRLALAAVVTALALVAVQVATVVGHREPRVPGVRTSGGCPDAPMASDAAPVHLVADLDTVQVREGASAPALLAVAEQVASGAIPLVRPRPVQGADPLRYLYDEGVALRRVVGVLGYAYAATADPRHLDAMAAQTLGAARWADWNPDHPLDTAQVGAAVALGFAWSRHRMTPAERVEVLAALETRLVTPYVCGGPSGLGARRTGEGNQVTVVGTAVVLAGLAARGAAAWSDPAVRAGTGALARHAVADGSGRSLADGPTAEGLMYTSYEAANVALLAATVRASGRAPGVARPLAAALPRLDALAAWYEHCGRVVEPPLQDGWAVYPWVDRTTALAALAASPESGARLLDVYESLQARGRLTQPGVGEWVAPDGIAELVLSQVQPGSAPPAPTPDVHVGGGPATARYYGCATHGDTYAVLAAVPNSAPHAHDDIGNVVVKQGEQTLLDDLGQQSYGFTGGPVWRAGTMSHSTLGVRQDDGSVLQRRTGGGAVAVEGDEIVMTSTSALPGVTSWQRRVWSGDQVVRVHDRLTAAGGASRPLSMSFLLAAAPAAVVRQPDGALRFTVADGSVWELDLPQGTTATVTDAAPRPPYVDAPDLAPLAAARTLVVLQVDLVGSADLTTTLRRAG